jgi:hypothetical protein
MGCFGVGGKLVRPRLAGNGAQLLTDIKDRGRECCGGSWPLSRGRLVGRKRAAPPLLQQANERARVDGRALEHDRLEPEPSRLGAISTSAQSSCAVMIAAGYSRRLRPCKGWAASRNPGRPGARPQTSGRRASPCGATTQGGYSLCTEAGVSHCEARGAKIGAPGALGRGRGGPGPRPKP